MAGFASDSIRTAARAGSSGDSSLAGTAEDSAMDQREARLLHDAANEM
jgi:hypothetical protein